MAASVPPPGCPQAGRWTGHFGRSTVLRQVLPLSSGLGFMEHNQLCGFGTVTERFQETQLLSSTSWCRSQVGPQLSLGAEPLYFQKSPSLWPAQDPQPRGTEAQVRSPKRTQLLPSPPQQAPGPGVRGGVGRGPAPQTGCSRYSLLVLFRHLFHVRHGLCSPSRKRKTVNMGRRGSPSSWAPGCHPLRGLGGGGAGGEASPPLISPVTCSEEPASSSVGGEGGIVSPPSP